jgi:cytochrome c peroxidase
MRPAAAIRALALLALSALLATLAGGARGGVPEPWEAESPLRPLPAMPPGAPVDLGALPFRVTPEKVRLGRLLFHDPLLSADGTVSCASCHRPSAAFSEPTATSTGIGGRVGARKAPPVLNAAARPALFWDGRAATLAEQAKGPMVNPMEMGNTHAGVVAAVSGPAGYRRLFGEAFGDAGVDIERVAEAIAAYEATLLSGGSAFDRFTAGDESALGPRERAGRDLFFGRALCSRCHSGPDLTDGKFHNIGVGWRAPAEGRPPAEGLADPGRVAVTGAEADRGAFKTPTLRNLASRAPYMHDGSQPTLRKVVEYYRFGGERNPWLAKEMTEADISCDEVDLLVAFLGALEGTRPDLEAPRTFPR